MKIVVGLGNFGDRYAYTFHNMGFLAAECLADKLNLKFDRRECDSLIAVGYRGGEKLVIAKPLTYMNLSGVAVKQLLAKYKAEPHDLIVMFDDVDIPKGSVRVRLKGSGGTHNGMRNIVKELNTEQFARVRIGTKTDELANHEVELIDFVLSKVDFANKQVLQQSIDTAVEAFEMIIEGDDIQRIQERVNRKK